MIFNDEVDVTDTASDCNLDTGSQTGGPTELWIANVGDVIEWGGPDVTFGTGIPIAAGTTSAPTIVVLDNVSVNEVFLVAETTGTARIAYKRNG